MPVWKNSCGFGEWTDYNTLRLPTESPFKLTLTPLLFQIPSHWRQVMRESPSVAAGILSQIPLSLVSVWHEYCWWCNDLSMGKTDFFFPSVPYGILWDSRQCKPSLKSFRFAWKKLKIKPTKNGHARFPKVCENKMLFYKVSILTKAILWYHCTVYKHHVL